MILDVFVGDQPVKIQVPEVMMAQSRDFFDKMDQDMDRGWKMGPTYVENPDKVNRAQIVADKMLTAIETENQGLAQLMAAYIVARIPDVKMVKIDIYGEPLNTEIIV